MNKQIEALKLALEALEWFTAAEPGDEPPINAAITAIREALAEQPAQQDNPHPEYCKGYAAGLEAGAISEKKSAQQQEPVAWVDPKHLEWLAQSPDNLTGAGLAARQRSADMVPLYTSPPASKPWQGLTDEEMHACWDSPLTPLGMKHARMIEAKLKGKNG